MNVKEYIESGIIEAYILGALPEQEQAEVARNIAQYPELADEAAAIEAVMQRFAESIAKEPPAFMQDKIWKELQDNSTTNLSLENDEENEIRPVTEPKVIPLAPPHVEVPGLRWQRAAIWIALIGSMIVNMVLWSQRNKVMDEQVAMRQQMDTLQQQQQRYVAFKDTYEKEVDIMSDSSVRTIVMKSMKPNHPMLATVYWSSDKGATYLSAQKLPMPPKGMQYQMWVIQDGKPVSMGVLPNNMIAVAGVARLPMEVKSGQAFAISLEKEGGSPTPTPENIYVMGKITS